jgi:hypothetical protein
MPATRKRLRWVVIMARVVTVNDVLDGHVQLDIECLDRIYLNAYVPIPHVLFLYGHLGLPVSLSGAVQAAG